MSKSLLTAWVSLAVVIGSPLIGGVGAQPLTQEPKKEEPKKDEPKKDEPKKDEPKKAETPGTPIGGSTKKAAPKPSKIKPYDEIVTSEFKPDAGLFMVHRGDENKILYEIPVDMLGKEMLWVRSIEKTATGTYGGFPLPERVVRWEQRGDDILLRDVKYDIRADTKDPIVNAIAANSLEPIISVFPVKAYGKDKAPVIDVTEIFASDMPEFSVGSFVGGAGADPRKTFVESVKSFPENIETKVMMTYRRAGGGAGRPGMTMPGAGGGAITVLAHHSMVKLPDDPMKPRKYDDRVGFFTEEFEDYGNIKNHQVENVKYITRWRLEKKDPNAEVSEPKKPIVFYVGRGVPEKFRAAVKKGVEAWQPAFEKAGFKNAIICKDAPSLAEDPDWDAQDARYSTLGWHPSTTENAMGPHVHDPRTGEILESDIILYHNLLKLARDWYFVQASPNDPKAQQLPLPDDLVSDLVTYIVTHEVGHTLGFPHNMKASSAFSVAQLRDPKFCTENGTEASIMDYGRFNYVAQPEDKVTQLIPKIGPYDRFAVEWGYSQFKDADTFEKEKVKLDEIVARQLKDKTLLFGGGGDTSAQTEDLSDDAVAATELGLKNIDRVAGYLVKATSKKGEDYEQLRNMYSQLLGQRTRELMHVISSVGGSVQTNFFFGDADKQYAPIPAEQQKKAVLFLANQGLAVPKALIAPEIVARLEANGAADRILNGQRMILRSLLSENRVKKMSEQVALDPKGYSPADMLTDLGGVILADLKADKIDLDLYKRNLIRAYIDILISEVSKDSASSDLPALARGQLKSLQTTDLMAALPKGANPTTTAFLEDLHARVSQALSPKTFIQGGSGAPSQGPIIFGGDIEAPREDF